MSAEQACKDHPNVKAIANCERCETPLCGMCSRFTDSGVYCERCLETLDREKFVAAQTEQLQKPGQVLQVDNEEDNLAESVRSKPNYQIIQAVVIACSLAFIFFRLNSNSGTEVVDSQTREVERQLNSLGQCMMVFQQIGQALQNARQADPLLRCAQPGTPNIITVEGDDIRVSHPNPEIFGYSELFVSSSNPTPVLIPQE